jgi:hypothetical protein
VIAFLLPLAALVLIYGALGCYRGDIRARLAGVVAALGGTIGVALAVPEVNGRLSGPAFTTGCHRHRGGPSGRLVRRATAQARPELSETVGAPRQPDRIPHPCPHRGTEMRFTLIYPDPELHSHWPCPVDGTRWELTMDGERLAPFGTRHREPAGRRPE